MHHVNWMKNKSIPAQSRDVTRRTLPRGFYVTPQQICMQITFSLVFLFLSY